MSENYYQAYVLEAISRMTITSARVGGPKAPNSHGYTISNIHHYQDKTHATASSALVTYPYTTIITKP